MFHQEAVAEVLRAVSAAMEESGFHWYLFGAQAAIVWGSPRYSDDVDITVDVETTSVRDLIAVMRKHGFELRSTDEELMAKARVYPFVHGAVHMAVDIVLAGAVLEGEFLERAVNVDIEGVAIPVISPEDLIITKILAGRPKDIEDVRNVIDLRRDSLDASRIREVLALLEQALTQSDLLPAFEREWHNVNRKEP